MAGRRSSSSMSLASLEFLRAGRIWTTDGWLLAPHFNASCLGTCPKPARRKAASPSQSTSFSLRVHDVRPVNPLHHLHEHSRRKVAAVRERPGSLKVRCARALLSRMLFPLGSSCSAHPLPLDELRNLCMAADRQTGEGIEEAIEDGTHTSTPITDPPPPANMELPTFAANDAAKITPRSPGATPSYTAAQHHDVLTPGLDTLGGPSNMSSLSRRACFKCGNIGHYAEVCSSSERLCYNCPHCPNQPAAHMLTKSRQAARPRVQRMPASPHHRKYVTCISKPLSWARNAPEGTTD
jgi:hypothetical protein